MSAGGSSSPPKERGAERSAPPTATGAAPGKVILFGEHAVVYGRPAVAAPIAEGLGATAEIDLKGPRLDIPAWGLSVRLDRAEARFDAIARAFAVALDAVGLLDRQVRLTVDGGLPPGVGLGSSAAFAVAVLRCLSAWRVQREGGAPLSGEALLAAAHAVETVFHGTPSGLDHTVIITGQCLRYVRDPQGESASVFAPVSLASPVSVVVGVAPRQGNTRAAVTGVRNRREALPKPYEAVLDAIGAVTEAGIAALAQGDWMALGRLFDLNHGLLVALGVSNADNDRMVHLAREHGALGAKLTGGGQGGAMLALTPQGGGAVVDALQAAGYQAFATRLGGR